MDNTYELSCYLLVAVFGLCGLIKERRAVLAAFTAIWFFGNLYHHPIIAPYFSDVSALPRLLTYFAAGVTFYLYRDRLPFSRKMLIICILLLALTIRQGLVWTLPVCGAYALFYFVFHPKWRWPDFAKHGDLSYGVYLYAFPIQQLLVHYAGNSLNPFTLFVAALPITCVAAMASWRFVESPFLQHKLRTA